MQPNQRAWPGYATWFSKCVYHIPQCALVLFTLIHYISILPQNYLHPRRFPYAIFFSISMMQSPKSESFNYVHTADSPFHESNEHFFSFMLLLLGQAYYQPGLALCVVWVSHHTTQRACPGQITYNKMSKVSLFIYDTTKWVPWWTGIPGPVARLCTNYPTVSSLI